MSDTLVGKRVRIVQIKREYDPTSRDMVEVSRQTFHATIVAVANATDGARLVVLYDSGELMQHPVRPVDVTEVHIEQPTTEGPFR